MAGNHGFPEKGGLKASGIPVLATLAAGVMMAVLLVSACSPSDASSNKGAGDASLTDEGAGAFTTDAGDGTSRGGEFDGGDRGERQDAARDSSLGDEGASDETTNDDAGRDISTKEAPSYAKGSWKLVGYQCADPWPSMTDSLGMELCTKEIGTVFEFEDGCLFGGENCVDGLQYSCSISSSSGLPAVEETHDGYYDEDSREWRIEITYFAYTCATSMGTCNNLERVVFYRELLFLEPADG